MNCAGDAPCTQETGASISECAGLLEHNKQKQVTDKNRVTEGVDQWGGKSVQEKCFSGNFFSKRRSTSFYQGHGYALLTSAKRWQSGQKWRGFAGLPAALYLAEAGYV